MDIHANILQPAMDDDDEEEEEEETDSENEQPAVVPEPRRNDEAIEGGVAETLEPGKARRKASQADITLFLTCTKSLPFYPDHPVLKPGVTMQIGMGKTSYLKFVFERYVEVCNEQAPQTSIDLTDLEFVHSVVLNGDDNAEGAALMKNDRISVRPDSEHERRKQMERHSRQRESDRKFFSLMRSQLLFIRPGDTYLRCSDDVIECHSFIVRKRCPWLCKLIDEALSREMGRQSIITVPGSQEVEKAVDPAAAHIENDEEEPSAALVKEKPASKVWVNLDFPVTAVRLLLEYCYTNRVHSLGINAFVRSSKTTAPAHLAPVAPFSLRRWPNLGEPTVSLSTTLSALELAKKAEMPRFALKCEVAASHLVDADSAVLALKVSHGLPILRRAATERLLRAAEDIHSLDMPQHVLPVLLSGVSDCMADRNVVPRKRSTAEQNFSDAAERERERRRHRHF